MGKPVLQIGFIGAGIVGSALAGRLSEKGYDVTTVASRSFSSAEKLAGTVKGCRAVAAKQAVADLAGMVFITTPDDAIAGVVNQVNWHSGQSVVHCSGADSLDVLETARLNGANVGGFHPLQTFATAQRAMANLPGSTFGIEAEEPLFTVLKDMAEALEGNWVRLTARDKVAYHAAAVISSNYLVALVKLATDLWQTFEVPPEQATRALLPLIKGTVSNIENIGIPNALTGPIARGDAGTVIKHLAMLDDAAPAVAASYRELGRQTVPVALAKGKINEAQAARLQEILGPKGV